MLFSLPPFLVSLSSPSFVDFDVLVNDTRRLYTAPRNLVAFKIIRMKKVKSIEQKVSYKKICPKGETLEHSREEEEKCASKETLSPLPHAMHETKQKTPAPPVNKEKKKRQNGCKT